MALPSDVPRLVLDRRTRRYAGGRLLVGGRPRRALRLGDAGVAALTALQAGPGGSAALADRLVEAGVAHPRWTGGPSATDVTAVVPVRDRATALDTCLAALRADGLQVVVVDDASADEAAVAQVAHRHGARLVRRAVVGGPAAARNTALGSVRTDLVAFVDSDVVPPTAWLAELLPHFRDPRVAAVAPRVRPLQVGAGAVARFLAARSPLDMGPDEGPVRPLTALPYLPSTALVVRRSALGAGFEEALRYGEDVDLVWRLLDAGWRVRYEPRGEVRHAEPATLGAVLRRRARYGTSAGPLARRHPGRLAPAVLPPAPTVALALVAGRQPLLAGMAAGVSHGRLAHRLGAVGAPRWLPAALTAQAHVAVLLGAARAATTLLGPAAVVTARRRRAVGLLLLAPPLVEWGQHRPRLDPLRYAALALLDDAAYGAGVWWGSLRARTAGPLRPRWR